MSRTSRKARAFRPSLSDNLESRVVLSTFSAFQARQAALNNLIAHRQTMMSQRQGVLGQRQANLLASRQAARMTVNPYATTNFSTLTTARPLAATNFATLTTARPLAATNFATLTQPNPYATRANFAGLTPGGYGTTFPFANSTLNTGMYGYGSPYSSNVSNATFANNLSTSMFANNLSTSTFANNLTNASAAATGNRYFGNIAGTGLSNYFGPYAYSRPSVANSLYSTNTFGNTNLGGLGMGAAYARSGAYNYGSLYNTYVGSGAYGGPFSTGFGGVSFV